MNLKFFVDNNLVREPIEYRSLELELNYENLDELQSSISQEKFTWVLENADVLNDYLANGTSGGLGVYWGVPFRIELDSEILFDGYIDLTNEAEFSCEQVIGKIVEAKKLDWLEQVADGFSFELLYDRGIIKDNDFQNIAYILSEVPDYRSAAMSLFMSYSLGRELATASYNLGKNIADVSGYFTTIAGVIKFVLTIAYLATLLTALIKLTDQLIKELISEVKYHRGMLVKTHFERACQYLGFNFSSSIFDSGVATNNELSSGNWANLSLLPFKTFEGYKKGEATNETGFYRGTFGDFIRGMSAVFNAKFTIVGSTFHFERRDFGSSSNVYKIPDVRRDFFGINASDIVSNYLVQFQIDNQDFNTVNRYKGTNAKNFITSKVKDPNRVELIRGFEQPAIPFALGKRKNELTRVEKIVKGLIKVVNVGLTPIQAGLTIAKTTLLPFFVIANLIIKAINAFLPKEKEIDEVELPAINVETETIKLNLDERLGMLLLGTDFVGTDKLILTTTNGFTTKVTTDNETKLSAETLWNQYHYIESFVPTKNNPSGNQKYEYFIETVPFCLEDYYKIRGLNNENEGEAKILSPEGNPARILSLKWNIWDETAQIKYQEERLFTNNLQQTLIINEGQ